MAKKTSKIIQQKAPPIKEKLSGGAKFGISLCIIAVAALAFAVAEHLGVTGTHFLFKGEPVAESGRASSAAVARADRAKPGTIR
ncbi:MAG: hypothetical protein IJX22_05805, partial [Opitutales bacterium]|nr:hypothetical protein [Opitutales bacterium]